MEATAAAVAQACVYAAMLKPFGGVGIDEGKKGGTRGREVIIDSGDSQLDLPLVDNGDSRCW